LVLPDDVVVVRLDPATFVPAPSQGAIAVQVRENDMAARKAVAELDEPACRRAVQTERAALHLADGGCTLPFGAWCTTAENGMLTLTAALGLEDGSIARSTVTGADPQPVAAAAWGQLARVVST
jgi:hydroxymethylbilane synthase